jgi:predicted TIM-barrel fold metal-dependent hydrolase
LDFDLQEGVLRLVSLVAALVLSAGFAHAEPLNVEALPPAAADHHIHIQGPEITAELKRIAAKTPDMFKDVGPGILNERTGVDAIAALDASGIRQGVILSEAYMFASPFSAFEPSQIAELTRRENAYNVAAALASNGRLIAFISVNPLWAGAVDEIRYWAGKPGVSGIKLHFGNSQVHTDSDADIAKLAAVLDAARESNLPMVIHSLPAQGVTAAGLRRFIDEVLPHAGDLPLQIAHGGAGGGALDSDTLTALTAYGDAILAKRPGTAHMIIDLAVVVIDDETDPVLAKAFADQMRRIGLDRFVAASDWPAPPTPKVYMQLMETQLPLTDAEWRQVLANRAPWVK